MGAKGTGKTSLAVSASEHAPEVLDVTVTAPVDCKDVVVIQLDTEGILGAVDLGLEPRVIDLSSYDTWQSTERALANALKELKPLCASGEVKYVAIDLGELDMKIRAHVNPQASTDWEAVRAEGLKVFRALTALKVTLIGMSHTKAAFSAFEAPKAGVSKELASTLEGKEARAVGGERAQLTMDLSTGVAQPWRVNASMILVRERKRKMDFTTKKTTFEFVTHTQGSQKFEAGNRAMTKLAPIEKCSLKAMLRKVYG